MKTTPNSTQPHAHLNEVPEELVGLGVGFLDLLELVAQPHGVGLEVEVGVLSPRDLVLVDVRVARLHGGRAVEGGIEPPRPLPVLAVLEHPLQRDACGGGQGEGGRGWGAPMDDDLVGTPW